MKRMLPFLCAAVAVLLGSCRSGGAPAGLAGKTLHMEIPVTMNEGLSSPHKSRIPLDYRFKKATESEKSKGGLTLSYTRTGKNTASAKLSGTVGVEYTLTFKSATKGLLTVKRTAKNGKITTQDGTFRITR